VPEVFRIDEVFIVRVYREQDQPEPPHCHVVWPDHMARLTLPDLHPLAHSDDVPKRVLEAIEQGVDAIVAKWNRWNPLRQVAT
jgi:hypothetical protein